MKIPKLLLIAGATSAFLATIFDVSAQAAIVPNGLFSDGAVLQQKIPVPVWGTADPGEKVTVAIDGITGSTIAGADGSWLLRLSPIPAGGPYTLNITGAGTDSVTINNVLVGEVWIASGQSNMELSLGATATGPQAIAASTDPSFHFIIFPHTAALTPQTVIPKSAWVAAAPDTVPRLSAVAYFFARDLRRSEKVPIGIIESNWGGTVAEAWTDRDTLTGIPSLKYLADNEDKAVAGYPAALAAYQAKLPDLQAAYAANKANYDAAQAAALAKYNTDLAAATAAGTPPPAKPDVVKPPVAPAAPVDPAKLPLATHLFNGMIAPIVPYGIRGAIWYQGESNGNRGVEYQTLFPAMIGDWRKVWGEGNFPFYFVQLAPFTLIRSEPDGDSWAELREAQRLTTINTPNTGEAVIVDVGDQHTIHPKRKEPVGDRLALLARALTYGEKVEYTGPVFSGIRIVGGAAQITFTHADGLTAGAITDGDGTPVASADKVVGFTIAGADGVYHPADAVIQGTTVTVSSTEVPSPVSVRYGWNEYPVANLENSAGLWASPFRTDTLPLLSSPKTATPPAAGAQAVHPQ